MQYDIIQTINNAAILDFSTIFTSSKNTTMNSNVIINDISDHYMTFIQPTYTASSNRTCPGRGCRTFATISVC